MDQSEWSEWLLFQTLNFKTVPPKPGVYELRWVIDGKPQIINRANGVDRSGLLYVGQSVNLRRRIKGLWQNITEGKLRHTAGRTYTTYHYERKFPPEQLQVRWTTQPRGQSEKIESKLLDRYVNEFLDKPPLNISIKRTKIPFDIVGAYSDR